VPRGGRTSFSGSPRLTGNAALGLSLKGAILIMLQNGGRKGARAAVEVFSARFIAFCAALALVACATLSADSSNEAKQAAVKKRAEARWTALVKGDVSGSYALLSPASKAVLTEEQYRDRMRRNKFDGIDIGDITCSADACKVKVWITFDATPLKGHTIKGIRTAATETWVMDRGEYWYVWPN
jgi:hypothetical protein